LNLARHFFSKRSVLCARQFMSQMKAARRAAAINRRVKEAE